MEQRGTSLIMPLPRLRGFDVAAPALMLLFDFDPEMPSGQWKAVGNHVLVHCPACAHEVAHILACDPEPRP